MSLATNVQNLAIRAATEDKALRTLVNGNVPDLSALTTTAKSNLVAAINELVASVTGASGIDDATTSTTTSWSSTKTQAEIDEAVAALVNGAPTDRDTLAELGALLANGEAMDVAINTALGNRVRVDAAQSFTAPQQAQGRANIGAAATADLGDPATDFVATFNNGLV